MMPRKRQLSCVTACLAALSLLGACSESTAPEASAEPLAVTVTPSELRLVNRSSRPVYTFVIERERLARINWAPCADPAACPGLAPWATQTVRFSPENDLAPGREAVVTWWYARRTATGYEPHELRSFVVRL